MSSTEHFRTGTYNGPEERFKERRALLLLGFGDLLKAQFNEGADWEIHGWITFPVADWILDEII